MINTTSAAAESPTTEILYKGYETPAYTVIKKLDDSTEVREYAPNLVAEVTVKGTRDSAINEGFRILANYIFGNNVSRQKIAMTSPVIQEQVSEKIAMTSPVLQKEQADGSWTVTFVMPSSYTLETLPKAKNDAIKFTTTAKTTKAVLRFSGFANDSKISKMHQQLVQLLQDNKLPTTGKKSIAYYDDPFTLPWNRRNEVLVELPNK